MPKIFLNEREGQIDTSAHSRGRIKLSIFDENWISLDFQVFEAGRKQIAITPVCDDAPIVEQAGRGEDKRPGAYGRYAADA
jgi:hypothetical protein